MTCFSETGALTGSSGLTEFTSRGVGATVAVGGTTAGLTTFGFGELTDGTTMGAFLASKVSSSPEATELGSLLFPLLTGVGALLTGTLFITKELPLLGGPAASAGARGVFEVLTAFGVTVLEPGPADGRLVGGGPADGIITGGGFTIPPEAGAAGSVTAGGMTGAGADKAGLLADTAGLGLSVETASGGTKVVGTGAAGADAATTVAAGFAGAGVLLAEALGDARENIFAGADTDGSNGAGRAIGLPIATAFDGVEAAAGADAAGMGATTGLSSIGFSSTGFLVGAPVNEPDDEGLDDIPVGSLTNLPTDARDLLGLR